jgi:hypothetical protein
MPIMNSPVLVGAVIAANPALAVNQHEARAVLQFAVDIAQHEGAAVESVEGFLISGKEKPAAGLRMIARGISGEHRGRIALRVHRERNQAYIGQPSHGRLDASHLRAHARAGAGTMREDEIRDPDFAVEHLAIEGLPGLRNQLEVGHPAVHGHRRNFSACGECESKQKTGDDSQSQRGLRDPACRAA